MKSLTQIARLIYINYVLARHGVDRLVAAIPIFAPLRFVAYANPWNWRADKDKTRGERLRRALEELGPIFIKFGQMLSTRRDLLPEDIADELAKLQDRVPGFPGTQAQAMIEAAFKKPLATIFHSFDLAPLASASIAQVHLAQLESGEEVVVKVLRPGVAKLIQRDIRLMYTLAAWLEKFWPESRRLKPLEVVAEFEITLTDELDLQREAANASLLRRNFMHSPLIYVPKIYWDYTRKNIIVMERIKGVPIANIALLRQHNVNLKKLAERGVEIFFTQVFRDCFFHADMHPGNIFVDITDPENPQYKAVDFGIMGTLVPQDQRYLAENLLAFFKRDYRRVAQLHVESGWVPQTTRVDQFEAAIRTVCEPIFERPLSEISFGHLLLRLFQTARRFDMQMQPQLVLLQKTLLSVEGLGRQLYPELDLWTTAKPYLEKWIKQQVGPRAMLRKIKKYAPYWAEKLPELPNAVFELIQYKKITMFRHEQQRQQHEKLLPIKNTSSDNYCFCLGFLTAALLGVLVYLRYF